MMLALLAAAQVVGVLEFRNKADLDGAYLSDQVRSAVKELLPGARVITRENMLVLLQGRDPATCEGECEVETGRRIGADLVVSGELLRFGTQYKLNLKLHDTRTAELLAGTVASGATADELDKALRPAVEKLLAPLRPQAMQDKLSDDREAARKSLSPPKRRSVLLSPWATAGYASVEAGSAAATGFAYGFGAQLMFRLVGPLYLGPLVDYSIFPALDGGHIHGFLGGGAVRVDLGEAALSAGGGYSDLFNGIGYGFLGAVEYGVLRIQGAWRHGEVISVQAGLQINL